MQEQGRYLADAYTLRCEATLTSTYRVIGSVHRF